MKPVFFLFLFTIQFMCSSVWSAEGKYDFLRDGEAPNLDSILIPERVANIPHVGLLGISELYDTGTFPTEKVEKRIKFLKAFFLTYSNQYARASINHIEKSGASSTFLRDVDEIRQWYVRLMVQAPDIIKKVANEEDDRFLSAVIAKNALRKEERLTEISTRLKNVKNFADGSDLELFAKINFHYAQQGVYPAVFEMAKAYSSDGLLSVDPAKRYFWLRHLEWLGADVKTDIEQLKDKMDRALIDHMDGLFVNNAYPDAMVKPQSGWKIIGGPNRRWLPPYQWKKED